MIVKCFRPCARNNIYAMTKAKVPIIVTNDKGSPIGNLIKIVASGNDGIILSIDIIEPEFEQDLIRKGLTIIE